MVDERFLMVSLDDEKSKKLAQVIGNATSRKILKFLSERKVSESDIAKTLRIPLSTVHYNVQALLSAGLIESKDFVWSDKGNKIWNYSVAKKAIVIAPKGSSFLQEIKKLSFVVFLALIGGGVVHWLTTGYAGKVQGRIAETVNYAESAGMEKLATSQETFSYIITGIPKYSATWFLIGAGFAILIYLLISLIFKRGGKR